VRSPTTPGIVRDMLERAWAREQANRLSVDELLDHLRLIGDTCALRVVYVCVRVIVCT
jgi:hypothetical protein